MKKYICFLVIASLLLLCGCVPDEKNTFRDHLDEIVSIQIVELTGYDESNRFAGTVIAEISDIEAFKEDLLNVEYHSLFGTPMELYVGYVVIKLTYNSGNYDLIHYSAQKEYREDRSNYGHTVFDQQQFEELIEKHLPDDIIYQTEEVTSNS